MRTLQTIRRTIARAFRQAFAPFHVLDSYGTSQHEWTEAAALEWLPACAPGAVIVNRYAGRMVAVRIVGASAAAAASGAAMAHPGHMPHAHPAELAALAVCIIVAGIVACAIAARRG